MSNPEDFIVEDSRFAFLVQYLKGLYRDWEGVSQFKGTVRRLEEMYEEFCWTPERIKEELREHTALFDDGYGNSLDMVGIQVVTLCPHHLLPCSLSVDISYIPKGKVLGISKFARIATIVGKRPIMQEMYTRELAEELFSRIDPIGVRVEVTGLHGCMLFRGVLQETPVTTRIVLGEI